MAKATGKYEPRPRRYQVFRLRADERKFLEDLGHNRPDRYTALVELTEILRDKAVQDSLTKFTPERRPLRLGIPNELDKEIKRVSKLKRIPYVAILLRLAQEWQKRNLLPKLDI
jgi:hypothetical protein